MFSKAVLLALAASTLVAGHGKPTVVQGNAGGNGTALGNQGGVVALAGPNAKVSRSSPCLADPS